MYFAYLLTCSIILFCKISLCFYAAVAIWTFFKHMIIHNANKAH